MTQVLIETLLAGLKLWGTKESRRYVDQVIELKRTWHEEYNKPLADRSDAVLDHVERELRILAIAFCTSTGEQNSANQH